MILIQLSQWKTNLKPTNKLSREKLGSFLNGKKEGKDNLRKKEITTKTKSKNKKQKNKELKYKRIKNW